MKQFQSRRMRVTVIGAGVVGIVSAWFLARRGCEVVLLDGAASPAQGASYANGGQLSYSYVAPLASPEALVSLPRLLAHDDSPVRLRLRADPDQWQWLARFALACRAPTWRRTTAELLSLSALSRTALHELLAVEPLDFHHRRSGKLVIYRSPERLAAARALAQRQSQHGVRQQVLSAAEVVAMEPSLRAIGGGLAGGIHAPEDETGDCHRFAQALLARLQGMDRVRVHLGNRVHRLRREGRRVTAVDTDGGGIDTDLVVLAAGLGSKELLRAIGDDAPIYPLKGYSLSVPLDADDPSMPSASVTDYQRRIVYARLGGILRVAAMVDIGTTDDESDRGRAATLERQVHESFPWLDLTRAQAWCGSRPATPGGKPLIGRSRAAENLWLNIGHGALGFTLACGSAELLARRICGDSPPIDPRPFEP